MKAILSLSLFLTGSLAASVQISDLWANTSKRSNGASMHFTLTDPNYPADTPTECNLIWGYGSNPKENARCNNGQYYIRFPQGIQDIGHFTLELERVDGPIAEKGQVLLSDNANGDAPGTKWICQQEPQPGVTERCAYEGVLEVQV
ncbi:hypothetical protein EYZ11_000841 [Aspergillus tanneri]|uniref:AA1-like domain-containing protein n=1 Tax=Aspergillus tanneri TaxID=1220188 RepID=A0A4V3UQQ6_9EURO|nr:uncharacterized protein ATNIH1004_003159 [Aspergillus tanneri]KAA8650473.1 hypothetical protein ATNIH1004_003159 [Aspergillus tanneri]THC99680.1 hypothetical protein EYZ11_000841 [Aspergillus tanneri]